MEAGLTNRLWSWSEFFGWKKRLAAQMKMKILIWGIIGLILFLYLNLFIGVRKGIDPKSSSSVRQFIIREVARIVLLVVLLLILEFIVK